MTHSRKIFIILCFIGLFVLINNWWRIELLVNPIDNTSISETSVILYSTDWCPYCEKTRDYLQEAKINFSEKDIEKSAQAAEEHRLIGGVGVPTLKINQHIIHGFDRELIRNAIEKP